MQFHSLFLSPEQQQYPPHTGAPHPGHHLHLQQQPHIAEGISATTAAMQHQQGGQHQHPYHYSYEAAGRGYGEFQQPWLCAGPIFIPILTSIPN